MSLYYSVRMAPPTCQHGIYSFQHLMRCCHVLMAPPTCQHGIYTFQYIMMYCHVLRAPPTCQHGIYTSQHIRLCCHVLRAPPTCHLGIHAVTNASLQVGLGIIRSRELTKASSASPRQHSYGCICTPGAPINPMSLSWLWLPLHM